MGTKRRVAIWFKRGRDFVVKAPSWGNRVDLIFPSQSAMIAWAREARMVLVDGNKR